jgi:anti-sigma regulatory factor (Ser/Thr protein kinase)/CheY-like chemotaxis protein
VLVLGDGAATREMIASVARHVDLVAELVPTTIEALDALRRRDYDVVLTDPSTSIPEDLAYMREGQWLRPGLRVVMLAEHGSPEDVIEAMRAGAFACFVSMADRLAIIEMIRAALRREEWRHGIEVICAHRDWIKLRVNCRLLTAERLIHFMNEIRKDLVDEDRDRLIAAFREILINAMEHGCGFNPDQVIEVSAVKTSRAIVYHFVDPGQGFSHGPLPHAAQTSADPLTHLLTRDAQGMRAGGFGLLLARHLVDELIHNDRGNEVLLIKYTDK